MPFSAKRLLNKTRDLLRHKPSDRKDSFSQSGEDLIMAYIVEATGISNPSYLDVGAYHPTQLNNTNIFYRRGSRGINVDPSARAIGLFERYRPRDINLNVAIGDAPGSFNYYEVNAPTLNTMNADEAARYVEQGYRILNTRVVEVKTINSIVSDHHEGIFPDILSLDVEGDDQKILQSIDYARTMPKIICVETIPFSTTGVAPKNAGLISYLQQKGYMLYADTHINSIFVLDELWRNRK